MALLFSQYPANKGEWTNFGSRSHSYSIIINGISSSIDLSFVKQTVGCYGQIESIRVVGVNADGSWACKATYLLRLAARKCLRKLKSAKPFGPEVRPRLEAPRAHVAASGGAAKAVVQEAPQINVLGFNKCTAQLNSSVGVSRWSTTLVGLRVGSHRGPHSQDPPAAAAGTVAPRNGAASSAAAANNKGGQAWNRAPASKPVKAAAEPDNFDYNAFLEDDDDGEGAVSDEQKEPQVDTEAPAGAAEIGLIAMANANFHLPCDTFDEAARTAAEKAADCGGFGDFTAGGIRIVHVDDALTVGERGGADELPSGESDAVQASDGNNDTVAADDDNNGNDAFDPRSTFMHRSMWLSGDWRDLTKREPVRNGSKPPRQAPPRVKPVTQPFPWAQPGPCVQATVCLTVTNPDGSVVTTVGHGGCGRAECLQEGSASGGARRELFSSPLPLPGDPSSIAAAVASNSGTTAASSFSGAIAYAASGRAFCDVELRELSARLTAQLDGGSGSSGGGGGALDSCGYLDAHGRPVIDASFDPFSASSAQATPSSREAWAILRPCAANNAPADGAVGDGSSAADDAAASAGSYAPGVFAAEWARRQFSREDIVATGSHYKMAISEALKDACVKIRIWVPSNY